MSKNNCPPHKVVGLMGHSTIVVVLSIYDAFSMEIDQKKVKHNHNEHSQLP